MRNPNRIFSPKPLVQAIALALAVPALVQAAGFDPTKALTADQQPGMGTLPGTVAGGNFTPGAGRTATTGNGGTWVPAVGLTSGNNAIGLKAAQAVIVWGKTAGATFNNATNTSGGFNIGSGSTFYVINSSGGPAAVLNVDVSGTTSVIAGTLRGVADTAAIVPGGAGTINFPDIMIANPNGVFVKSTGIITTGAITNDDRTVVGAATPAGGVALLGVDLSGDDAKTAFATAIAGADGKLDVNFANSAPVQVQGSISGGATAPNTAAAYVLLAGADQDTNKSSNSGTITTNQFLVNAGNAYNNDAGKGAQSIYTLNTSVDVPRNATTYAVGGGPIPGTGFATSAFSPAAGSFVNSGTINHKGGGLLYAAANGAISNGSGGLIAVGGPATASSLELQGTGVTNSGTLQGREFTITYGSDGVSLGGTVKSFVTTADPLSDVNRIRTVTILPQTDATGTPIAQGDVTVTAPITVHSDTGTDVGARDAYRIDAGNITISAAQKVLSVPPAPNANANRLVLNTTQQGGNITIDKDGSLTAGTVRVGSDLGPAGAPYGTSPNFPNLTLAGSITTSGNNGAAQITDPNIGAAALKKADFLFNGFNLTGAGKITANVYDIYTRGSINNPVSNKDWLQNGLSLTPRGTNAQVAISAIGTARQGINVKITNTAATQIFSGVTNTPFADPLVTTGTTATGNPTPNVQSSLIVQGTGPLNVIGGFPFATLAGQVRTAGTFYFPGAILFKSDTGVVAGNIMNAWNPSGIPGQGVFLEAPNITTGWIAMNNGQLANFSTMPSAPPVTFYYTLGNNGATVNFLSAHAAYLNSYSQILNASIAGEDWMALLATSPFN